MARNFRRHRTSHPIADLNVTNLIDLGFMLLIIFMIATPLIQQEQTIPVNLPTVAKGPQSQAKPDDKFVAIGIDAKGFYADNNPTPLTLAQLRSKLNAYATEPKQPVIRLRGDMKVDWQKMAEVINELTKVGLTRVTFDTQTEP